MSKYSDPSRTVYELGAAQLRELCKSVDLGKEAEKAANFFRELAVLCGDRDLALPPRWSAVGDDCTPFEFSLEMHPSRSSLRLLVEAQADPASPQSYWSASDGLNAWLARNCQVDLSRFRLVEDLFVPAEGVSLHAATAHAVGFSTDGSPLFKLYLNPVARGRACIEPVVAETLGRLGFQAVVPDLLAMCGRDDVFSHVALDLFTGPSARLKVYVKHFNAEPADLDARCTAVDTTLQGEWLTFLEAILGKQSSLSSRPVYTAYHLTAESPDRIQRAALHLPFLPYVCDDLTAYRRVTSFLADCGLPTEVYARCVKTLANLSLESEQGIHSHVSYQRVKGSPRVAVYFGSRAYYSRYGWLSLDPQRRWPERCWPSPVPS